MRVLLTSNATYDPPRGGSTRSNLAWLEQLAAAGHECVVVCAASDHDTDSYRDGIAIQSFRDLARRTGELRSAIARFIPDWVLVTSEDLGHTLLREAAHTAPGRMIYLAHTPQWYPFGPESWHPDPAASELVRGARAIVAIGQHMAGYIERHLGVRPAVVHPPMYGTPPYPDFARFGEGSLLTVNPCEVKGIRIFAGIAQRCPDLNFSALAGWGTTRSDRAMLERAGNVEVLETVPSIDDVLSRTSVLLMPSLWYEGFGLITMEAMLRGIPVVASDSGGLEEAKRGTEYVVPVRPITKYLPEFDENGMPKAVVPEQDVEPWVAAVRKLTSDPAAYQEESHRSRKAAERFVRNIEPDGLERLLLGLKPEPLRILLAHNSLYYPSHGGGDKSNRILMESLASRGHEVRVVARIEHFGQESHRKLLQELTDRGIRPESVQGGVIRFRCSGVDVHTLTSNPKLRVYFQDQIDDFRPDIIITSTDDPAQLMFEVAARTATAHLVYLVRATIAVPFGPDASSPNAGRTAALARADAIVTVSEYVARYVRDHAGLDAIHLPISLPEPGPFPDLGRFDNPYVTMVNPCAVKGIAVFLALAEGMPEVQFAGVPTWGATEDDLAAMRRLPNVTLLAAADDIDEILRVTRVLLVPSVWAEARSRIVLEAMERGIPVMAANLGGLPEAKLGMPYILPVNPIRRYLPALDRNMVPVADVPPQDVGPWHEALQRLVTDRDHWQEIASLSRRTALEYGDRATAWPFEAYLGAIARRPKRKAETVVQGAPLDRLSAEKRKLLALRLRQRAIPTNDWFPGIETTPRGRLRLFCFPHAGGGTSAYLPWKTSLEAFSVCPVRLPGHESRAAEKPVESMTAVVRLLADAIEPWVTDPFAFFGHSMGAGIAFELTRELRRRGKPMPATLAVSGTRAPQLRQGWVPPPPPSDEELVAQLRRLEGVPADVLEHPEALALMLPALRADLLLFRQYTYSVEEPLPVPIAAYAGAGDPNVRPEQVQAWGEQTSAGFEFREFPGGHFFLFQPGMDFPAVLADSLQPLVR